MFQKEGNEVYIMVADWRVLVGAGRTQIADKTEEERSKDSSSYFFRKYHLEVKDGELFLVERMWKTDSSKGFRFRRGSMTSWQDLARVAQKDLYVRKAVKTNYPSTNAYIEVSAKETEISLQDWLKEPVPVHIGRVDTHW